MFDVQTGILYDGGMKKQRKRWSDKTDRLEMRVSPAWLMRIDDWRRLQPVIPTRTQAVRLLVERGLEASGLPPPPAAKPKPREDAA